ncbi:MAG: PKD domain-containing protein [Proteobacteria bacterium]|nr:PKD domain-containing protein [Pseudomonadota bacterium]
MRLSVAMPTGSTGMKLRFWGKASQFGASDQLLIKASVHGGPFATFDTLRPQDEGLNNDVMSFYGGNVGHGPVSTTWVPATASNVVFEIQSGMDTGLFTIGGSIEVRALIGNPSPVANAGPNQSATDAGGDGVESFTLDGSGSSDPNGSIVSYEWRDGPTLLGNTASVGATLSLGVHNVVLTVTDDGGETASDSAVITVGAVGCVTQADCDDGVFCNGAEVCDPVLDCQPGTAVMTDDGVACTVDSCDEVGNAVVNAVNDANCDNGQFCDGSETCHATLDCQAGTAVPIDDGVGCTDDSCDEVGNVVVNAADDNLCDDGDPCTAGICDSATGCSHVAVEGCAVSVPSADRGGRLLMLLLIGAAAVRELAYARRSARTRGQ